MARFILTFLIFMVSAGNIFAEDTNLSFAAIPQPLLKNATSVIRFYNSELNIYSAQKATMNINYAVTIVNESAHDDAVFHEFYNKFIKISDIKISVFDKDGKRVEKMDRQKLIDLSAIAGYSTYEDNRVLIYKPRYKTVPYTVEFSYEMNLNGILDFPDIYLFQHFNTSLEKAQIIVSAPDSVGFSYFSKNVVATSRTYEKDNMYNLVWEAGPVPAFTDETFGPPFSERAPVLMLAPKSFKIKGYTGNSESWKEFGKWFYKLSEGRDNLNSAASQPITKLIADTNDTLKRIQILYNYMQNRTRYASIQIGIGGWQPADANEVDRLGYGDCKALSNYMKAILKVANINSYVTLVKAGEEMSDIENGFPSNQFNHAILCVPVQNDTMWLECTSQHFPAGYLGAFTDDRDVLVVTENGGFIGHTKKYSFHQNIQNRKCNIKVLADGNAKVNMSTQYYGICYDKMQSIVLVDDNDKKKQLEEKVQTTNFKLDNFSITENHTDVPEITERIELTLNKSMVSAGDLMFFRPNQFTRLEPLAHTFRKRTTDIWINHGFIQIDTVCYDLPENFELVQSDTEDSFESAFGKYSFKTSVLGNKLYYTREFTLFEGIFPAESYELLVDFYNKISGADNIKVSVKLK